MIRLRQVKVLVSKNNLKEEISKKLKIKINDIKNIKIVKKSIDSRFKPNNYYVYEVDVSVDNEDKLLKKLNDNDIFKTPIEEYKYVPIGINKLNNKIIIVGSGPSGLFCGYILSSYGYKVLIIERGSDVDTRINKVNKFWEDNILDKECNVQFGEGGAGTFSDGKLNTLIKDKNFRMKKVFQIFVENGAKEDIMYENKPHIGTDILVSVVKNMRNKILENGGEIRFNTKLTNIEYENNKLKSIIVNNNEEIRCECLVLAIGHSARDTFKMLYENNINMEPKPFAIGVRIQHPQELINNNQYGKNYDKCLENASYKLTHTCKNKRGVYTFCMCPGGYVVNSSSEDGMLAINGMSYHARDSKVANSAVIVTVGPKDFGNNPLDGVEFQRKLETITYKVGSGLIPTQNFSDFIVNKKSTKLVIEPKFKGNYKLANLNEILPDYIVDSLKEGIIEFDKKIKGFASSAIISAIESRTSSPIRIIRNECLESNIKGIYPCGEGAGYAGGITSSAMDGIKIAEEIMKKYRNGR